MFETAGKKVSECIEQGKNPKSIITNLSFVLQYNPLLNSIRHEDVCKVIMETIQSIEQICSNGPLELMTGSLAIQAKTIIGFKN